MVYASTRVTAMITPAAYGTPANRSIRKPQATRFPASRMVKAKIVKIVEDVHEVGDAEVAIFGAPLDAGTTYRPGTRFGPQGIRRATNLFGTYNFELGVDLREQLNMVDIGDVVTIPGNLEKSFDQIDRAMAHVVSSGVFPVVLGGDHSIGYPTIRGMAPYTDGNIGIIHFDRHVDTQELDLDERMHTTPRFHATDIANAPPQNLVQIGIGGWQAPGPG
jgi:agmatinase